MIGEFVASLFASFVVEPVQAGLRERLEEARAPVEVVSQASDCLGTTGPVLLARAGEEPWWAVTTIVSVAVGWQTAAELLDAGNPACGSLANFLVSQGETG